MKFAFFILLLGLPQLGLANSFVGNGGSEGDVELQVTLTQMREIFAAVEKKTDAKSSFCTCSEAYKGRAACGVLNALTAPQARYCSETLSQLSPALSKLLDPANRKKPQIVWSDTEMEVTESGNTRAVDAVANRDKNSITVNLARFLKMQRDERVFLLSHEFMHFTDLDGAPLTDQGPRGPFAAEDGSHELVNAMASAASVLPAAYPAEVHSYLAKLNRSKAWKPIWFDLDFGTASSLGTYSDNFAFNNYQRTGISARYQWTNWGLVLSYRNELQSQTLTYGGLPINANESIDIFGAGVSYRFFVASDPMTFWGQSHLLLKAMAELVSANYSYGDAYTPNISDSAHTLGGSLSVNYYVPLFWGFWGYVGTAFEYHPYKYDNPDAQLNLNYNNNILSGYLGVSYAF